MHVCVIGAGVVGLASAWQLARDGHRVTIIDRHPEVAQEASQANGGQLSYSYVAPLAGSGVLGKLPLWLLDPQSPLRFVPRVSPDFWRWCLNFVARCNAADGQETTRALLSLAFLSQQKMREFVGAAMPDVDFDYRDNGKLVVYRQAESFDAARRQMAVQAEFGCVQSSLSAAESVGVEPALASVADRLVGAIHTPGESVADSFRFCAAMRQRLEAAPFNARFLLGHAVERLAPGASGVAQIVAGGRVIHADRYVIAAGIDSHRLMRQVGRRLPLMSLKGYSLTAPIGAAHEAPQVSVTDADRKIVFARLGDRLRVAGMVDLGDTSPRIVRRRIATLRRQAAECFPCGGDYAAATPWAGLRPATPSGRPIVDQVDDSNVWLNLGHGALGLTLAMGSARLLADRLGGRNPAVDPAPFLLKAA